MSGRRKWSEIRDAKLAEPGVREATERARARRLAEEANYARTLADVRRARQLTQEQLAAALKVSQSQVSRIETQADLYLSTLESYVRAMGGELELRAVFPNGEWASLTLREVLGEEGESQEAPARRTRSARRPDSKRAS